ncbi:MAG: rod shape-determining protein [Actinomycetota bacterium]|nr:rod shape-determining protein [Actinomycetota bacterium]
MLAVDFGSANTVVCDSRSDIIFDEPTLIAYDKRSGRVIGIGNEARDVVGRVSGYVVVERPIRDGRVSSTELLDHYVQALMRALSVRRFSRHRTIVALPASATLVESRSLMTALRNAGLNEVESLDSTLASAIGMGFDVYEPSGVMAVNLGAATTLSGIIAFGGVVAESHAFCGGNDLDRAIMALLKYRDNASVDEATAEEVKLALANVTDEPPRYISSFFGRDLTSGVPVAVEIDEESVRDVITDPIKRVIDVVLDNLSHCPAELAQDLVISGVHLCGGYSRLLGLADAIADSVKIPVEVADEPRYSTARGLARYGVHTRNKR